MTEDRTEEAGLTGLLDVTIGGAPVRLRALTIAESDTWLDTLARSLAATEVMDEGETSADSLRQLVTHASDSALDLVMAYDIEGALGDREAVRTRATKREIAAALEQMVTVEDPLGPGAARLVAAAYGLPAQLAADRMAEVSAPMLRLVRSLSTPSAPGTSSTPTSAPAGPASSSSSTGPTRKPGTTGKPRSAAS